MIKSIEIYLATALLLITIPTMAFGFGSGGGGGGCNCVPDSLIDDAEIFITQMHKTDLEQLRLLQFVGEICAPSGLQCGNLREDQASRLIDYHAPWWENKHNLIVAIIALLGLMLGGLSTINQYRDRKAAAASKQ